MNKNSNELLIFDPKDDGKTHINIFSRGKTKLGRMLSNFYTAPFDHPEYGHFVSVECFWYFISTGSKYEKLRTMPSYKVKQIGRTLPRVHIDNFMDLVKDAIRLKILQHNSILVLFRRNNLPYEHYYLFGPHEILFRPLDAKNLIDIFESLRIEFKETKPWLAQ